ncbi:MAG TPA: phage major capsid protein [Alphaproteobacteria bacterium]|nr:phage major capsid protein [Alphaproteobacteria bacterium]
MSNHSLARRLETKKEGDESSASMAEINKAVSDLGNTFAQFTQKADERLKQLEKTGSVDAVTADEVKKMNTAISDMQEKVVSLGKKSEAFEKIAMRPPLTGDAGQKQRTPEQDEHHKAFVGGFLRKGRIDGLEELQQKAMSVQSDPDGGYLAPVQMLDRMVKRLYETTPMRSLATVIQIGAEAVEFPRENGDDEAGWVGETDTRNDGTSVQVGMIRIPSREMFARPKITQKLLDDANFDVEKYITERIADRFARLENDAFVNGNTLNKPRGFATYPVGTADDASRGDGTFQYVAAGASADFGTATPADKLISLTMKVKAGFLSGASWLMPRAAAEKVRLFKDGQNNYIWQPGLQAGQPAALLGYAVNIGQDMPALAANSLSIAFGNFKEGYTIVDRMGLRILRDPFTAAPFVRFPASKRTGGEVTNFEAIKFIKFAAS